jgi:hypothetical protein
MQPVEPPALAHFKLEQNLEQHSSLTAHVLPIVEHVAPGTGWHVVPWQLLEQQSLLTAQILPLTVHAVDAQRPFWQLLRLQQSVGTLQGAPGAAHVPPAEMHTRMSGSHEPEQQSPPVAQAPPLRPHTLAMAASAATLPLTEPLQAEARKTKPERNATRL